MKGVYSHAWLQTFFEDTLPDSDAVCAGLLQHSFEVDAVRSVTGGDTVYELDILTNRSADCLAHYGVAKEISAIFSLPLKQRYFTDQFSFARSSVFIHTDACDRYAVLKIDGISLAETPETVRRHLEAIGQRCITPIVDLSNFILFDIGQPIHAFDARKVSGQFGVRQARADERLVLLGGDAVVLREDDVVITDASHDRAIALAGVKGGEETKVDADTKDIYVEIASFDGVSVRRTMRRTGYISDAAMRFSQGFPSELVSYTAHRVADVFGSYGSVTDSFDHWQVPSEGQRAVQISVSALNALLGTAYTRDAVAGVFDRLGFSHTSEDSPDRFTVTVPIERFDLRDAPDVTEEVGRILGYDAVPSVAPVAVRPSRSRLFFDRVRARLFSADTAELFKKRLAVLHALKQIGFSEIMTSSFCLKGAVCVAYPVAKDKGCLRTSLQQGVLDALEQNAYNGELLGLDSIQIVEIGSVFTHAGERIHMALGVREVLGRGKVDYAAVAEMVRHVLVIPGMFTDGVWEVPLEQVRVRGGAGISSSAVGSVQYVSPSKYPFVLRDVAVFVPDGVAASAVSAVLQDQGGTYLRQVNLFDSFEKDGKRSYAFRLVFQSDTETLDDTVVNTRMDILYTALKAGGFEVR